MPAIYVRLNPDAFDRLRTIAKRERRRPQDQAAVIVEREIVRATSERDEQQPRSGV